MNPDEPTMDRDDVNLETEGLRLAKVTWQDPASGDIHEFVLTEGATATIGRLKSNDICIPEEHVSRQHSVINYRDGIFVISDLGSSNGTFVNDEQITDEFPLASGDHIRLFVPILIFSSTVTEEDQRQAEEQGTLITATVNTGGGKIIISNGPQEGNVIPLLLKKITVGRATSNAQWEIALQDPSVSRPHARMQLVDETWVVYDLGSANGTFVNGTPVHERGRSLRDGDAVKFGQTLVLFRSS